MKYHTPHLSRFLGASLVALLLLGQATAQTTEAPPPKFPSLKGLGGQGGFGQNDSKSQIRVSARFLATSDNTKGVMEVNVKLGSQWHIYSTTQPKGGPVRTTFDLQPSNSFKLTGTFQPDKPPEIEKSPYFPVPEEKHYGSVRWTVPLQFKPGTDLGKLAIQGAVDGQICREGECVPLGGVDTNFTARFDGIIDESRRLGSPLSPPQNGASAATPIDTALLMRNLALGLLGGFILNFMPCVLPVIGLKVMSFVQQSQGHRGEAFLLNVIYSLGVIAVFMILAVLSVRLNLSWGEQFSFTGFKIGLIVLVFAMALSFLGFWEIPIPGFVGAGTSGKLAAREGASGAFFKGVFATLLATPCSGPLMGPLFAYSLDKPPYVTYALFLSLGLGMSLPYLVIGAFPEFARWIPKPGAWMETFKHLMGFVLLFTVVFLFYTLGDSGLFVPTLALIVAVWFACWLIGRVPVTASIDRKAQAWVYGVAFAAVVGFLSFRHLTPHGTFLEWQSFTPNRLASAQQEGKTVMLDFTANWCLNCKLNQSWALDTARVARLVEEFDIVPMLADWTNRDSQEGQAVKSMLDSLGRNAIPLLAIYPAQNPDKPILLDALLTESQVLEALRQAGPSRSATATAPEQVSLSR